MKNILLALAVLLVFPSDAFSTTKLYVCNIYFDKDWIPISIARREGGKFVESKEFIESSSLTEKQFLGGISYKRVLYMTLSEYNSYAENKWTTISYPDQVADIYQSDDSSGNPLTITNGQNSNPVWNSLGVGIQQLSQSISYMGISQNGHDSCVVQGYAIRFKRDGTPDEHPVEFYERTFGDYHTITFNNKYGGDITLTTYATQVYYQNHLFFEVVSQKYAKYYIMSAPDMNESMIVFINVNTRANEYIVFDKSNNKIWELIGKYNPLDPNNNLQPLLTLGSSKQTEAFLNEYISKHGDLPLLPVHKQLSFNLDITDTNKIPTLKIYSNSLRELLLTLNADYLHSNKTYAPNVYFSRDDIPHYYSNEVGRNFNSFPERTLYDGEIVK